MAEGIPQIVAPALWPHSRHFVVQFISEREESFEERGLLLELDSRVCAQSKYHSRPQPSLSCTVYLNVNDRSKNEGFCLSLTREYVPNSSTI